MNPNTTYECFLDSVFGTYDKYFSKLKIKPKAKAIQNPWITKPLQGLLRRNKSFINGFFKTVLYRMNKMQKL